MGDHPERIETAPEYSVGFTDYEPATWPNGTAHLPFETDPYVAHARMVRAFKEAGGRVHEWPLTLAYNEASEPLAAFKFRDRRRVKRDQNKALRAWKRDGCKGEPPDVRASRFSFAIGPSVARLEF